MYQYNIPCSKANCNAIYKIDTSLALKLAVLIAYNGETRWTDTMII